MPSYFFPNAKQSISGELPKDSLTIPSIIRRAQYENLEIFTARVQCDEEFVVKWFEVEKRRIDRMRTIRNELIEINDSELDMDNIPIYQIVNELFPTTQEYFAYCKL